MSAWLYILLLVFGFGASPPEGNATLGSDLDRIALAVEGVESSFGVDKRMWRPHLAGPQGPMQVSAAAAADVGSGDRFDPDENRKLGRAYLGLLYHRYGNWPDAIVAYYWGPGNVDRWTAAGHDSAALSEGLRSYVDRVHGFLLGAHAPPPASEFRSAAAIAPSLPAEPPPAEIQTLALRKRYLAARAIIDQVRAFLDATQPGASGGDTTKMVALIRRVAARPGFEEFALLRVAHGGPPPNPVALRQIAQVLLDKLHGECTAIAIVDRRQSAGRVLKAGHVVDAGDR